jgi:ubiquinone biosynthesis protein UbiJ
MSPLGILDRALLGAPERLLNRCIQESTSARELLGALAGETLTIEVLGLGLTLSLAAQATGIELLAAAPRENAAVTVRGTPLDLMRLLGADPSAALRGSRTEVSGQLELAQKFADLLRLARPDIAREAARWVGDVPANEAARVLAMAQRWVLATLAAAERDIVEYLQEEGRALPAGPEAKTLQTEVERLRDDVEQVLARIERLEQTAARRE